MLSLYKGKGSKSSCGDYRGISFLEAVGKIFSKFLSNRLIKWICPNVIPESQCGFRTERGNMDMIFSACPPAYEEVYRTTSTTVSNSVDLTKAFYTVNRSALWIKLGKLGCPPQFVEMLKQLHRNMKARVNVNGSLSEPIPVDNGVKQLETRKYTSSHLVLHLLRSYAFICVSRL